MIIVTRKWFAIILALAGFIAASTPAFAQNPVLDLLNGTDLKNDLVSYWPLDTIDDGVTTPDVIGGLDFELVNLSEFDQFPGVQGNAFFFDASLMTMLVRIHEPDDDLPANKHESFTISFWTQLNGNSQNDLRIFAEASTTDNNPLFNIGTDNAGLSGAVDFYIRNAPGGWGTVNHIKSVQEPLDDQWHHITFVEEAGQRRLYVDGQLDPLDIPDRPAGEFPLDTTSIGGILRAAPSSWVTGVVDEVIIWKRALTPDEISMVYNENQVVLIPSFTADAPSVYRGGSATLSWSVLDTVTALTLDPEPGDVLGMTTEGEGSLTVMPDVDTTYILTAEANGEFYVRSISVTIDSDIVSFSASESLIQGGETSELNWEVNPAASVSISGIGDVNDQTTDGFGSTEVSPTETTTYTLSVDNGGVVTTADVTVNVVNIEGPSTLREGLIAYWPLDQLLGTKTPDVVSGYDMDVSNITAADVVEGRWGQAFQFEAARNTLLSREHTAGDELPMNKHESYTLSMWTRVQGNGQTDLRVFSEGNTENSDPLYNIGTDNGGASGSVDLFFRQSGWTTVNHIKSEGQPFDGEWHHLVFVQENGVRRIFIDGVVDSLSIPDKPEGDWLLNNTSIGGILRGSASHWVTGLIDDVIIWNRALTDEEIAQVTFGGGQGIIPPEAAGLVAHWPLDEIQGTKTPDVVNGYDMDLSFLTTDDVVEGMVGNAFSFDASRNTLLSRVHAPTDRLPANKHESYTLTMWTKVQGNGQTDLRVFSEGNTENSDPLYNIGTDNGGASGSIDLFFRQSGWTTVNHIKSIGQPFDGEWHHFAFVQDNGVRTLFIDGVADSLSIPDKPEGDWLVNNTSIGGILRGSASHWVTGLIDEVAVWERALTPDEVAKVSLLGVPEVFSRPQPLDIRSFTADFAAATAGDQIVLRWDVSKDAQVNISPMPGDVTDLTEVGAGSVAVTIDEPTTFELTLSRAGEEPLTAQVSVGTVRGVSDGWRVLENFNSLPSGPIAGQGGWKNPAGQAVVVDLGTNKVLGFDGGDDLNALQMASLTVNEGESATLFFRFYVSPSNADPIAIHIGLTDKAIRFIGDFNNNVGPYVRFQTGADDVIEVGAVNGQGGAVDVGGTTLEPGVIYNFWINVDNRSLTDGDLYSVYVQADGDTERTLLFEDYLSDRVPEDQNNGLGPATPDLISLLTAAIGAQGTQTVLLDDFFLSADGFLDTVPVDASTFVRVDVSNIVTLQGDFDAGGFTLSWNSVPGATYNVESIGALGDDWTSLAEGYPDGGAVDIVTSYTDATASLDDPTKFYRVAFIPPPSLFSEDFEGAPGWTVNDLTSSGTTWELGTPTNGPGAAHGGVGAYGTDLDANYANNTDVLLLSPLIDLSGVTEATLSFWHFLDAEAPVGGDFFDEAELTILDEGGTQIGTPLLREAGTIGTWTLVEIPLPAEALDRNIRLQFRFFADDFSPEPQAGWFIDDVLIK